MALNRPKSSGGLLLIIAALVGCLAGSTHSAEWVNSSRLINWVVLGSFCFSALLATRATRTATAATLIVGYGMLLPTLFLARLWPIPILSQGWQPFANYTELQLLGLVDNFRPIGALHADSIAHQWLLGVASWLLIGVIIWWTLRNFQPQRVLVLTIGVLIINGYVGAADPFWAALALGPALLLHSHQNQRRLQALWQERNLPISRETRRVIQAATAILATLIVILAYQLPQINYGYWLDQLPGYRTLSTRFDESEDGVGRVEAPPTRPGIMPRDYLIYDTPTLLDSVMMTATVSAPNPAARHWRALSFDIYTGEGWTYSPESAERVRANVTINHISSRHSTTITQTINWVGDERVTRYSLGHPVSFDQNVVVSSRDTNDLFRVQGRGGTQYQVLSKVINAPAERLRAVSNAGVPVKLMRRYTQLPDSVSERVHLLASDIITGHTTPFDQAKAIETFLRQYEYNLSVEPPPEGADPVEYFLFEAQQGYCDYYAGAMVVLARSVGLPARMGVGYLAKTPNENGVQVIRKADAHTWAEIYFAGLGWVEFEPTAGFPIVVDENSVSAEALRQQQTQAATLPLPGDNPSLEILLDDQEAEVNEQRNPIPYLAGGVLILFILGASRIAQQQRRQLNTNEQYGRLLQVVSRLGVATPASQTPEEFRSALLDWFSNVQLPHFAAQWQHRLPHQITHLSSQYVEQQYANRAADEGKREVNIWAQLRWPMLMLRIWLPVKRWGVYLFTPLMRFANWARRGQSLPLI